jgi:hypothetical protein
MKRKEENISEKRVIGRSDTMVRTGHAIVGQAQFKGRRVKEEDTTTTLTFGSQSAFCGV